MRETMEFDVIIVGAGPAGLSAAIRLAQLSQQNNKPLEICVIEKGEAVGSHSISGAVLDPRALNELLPDWQLRKAPLNTPVTRDRFLFLAEKKSWRFPVPPQMRNLGNYIISLSQFCRWLAEQAEIMGVNIFPGFAATDIVYDGDQIKGVITGDKGVDKKGNPTASYQPGMELRAKQTLFAEGCRGSLTEMLTKKFELRKNCDPQTYGIGIKEVWEIPEEMHQPGSVIHSIGWPLDHKTYGGSFVYQFDKNLVSIGFITGLDYQNPWLNPYEEFQRFKTHPAIFPLLENGKRIEYGARCINEGGFQSIPELVMPGGLLIGCSAGFVNVPKIKGIHNAMKSGMLAAESVFPSLDQPMCHVYQEQIKKSWIVEELYLARNIRPAMTWGLWPGLIYSAIDTYILRGRARWTFHNHADFDRLKMADKAVKIVYPKHDNKITFDLSSSVYLTHSQYDENQPCHLKLKDPTLAIDINLKYYGAPEQRYCPAGVYEILNHETRMPYLQINAANCIHCKACDIKDPTQNITWTPPEGGSGPQYRIC